MHSELSVLTAQRPLVVHLVYSLDVGGLETLLVDCINRLPPEKYRHAVVCLTRYTEFAQRITQPGVELYALNKPPGNGVKVHRDFWQLMRRLRPAILHTYNLAAMEFCFTAAVAGVPVRIHAEHGRDAADPQGLNRKHNFLRRRLAPFIDRYIPVSDDLQRWLADVVGIPAAKNHLIKNGVDTERFKPRADAGGAAPWGPDDIVIGAVARVQDVKNHRGLVAAFALLRERLPALRARLKLTIVGDGPLLGAIREQVAEARLQDAVWLPGARADVAELLHGFDVFALPSLAEGTPVSLLEAMACGLPSVCSNVGGIPEVVTDGVQGLLVPVDVDALAEALARYAQDPAMRARHGAAARERIEDKYSMAAMLRAYMALYDGLVARKAPARLRQSMNT
ncbi:TIGR03088 family PEP-CTERM/XrtA system glycosyltransferase [Massilia oculi]|uniref:TIGR03088 family PEP-CTERM/XrtA system glycosyltransferase n=1 Tax=Massilia oculi TaxID=945844 RepID=A0A2S2DIU3_9BURK|nr:TIGR03088 family PEP-CTERM/XrtA system glycosyltransferase [Massilia oculi]AWL05272.1 TIGR03088 family PEP-CTERM/XrtA system glycosyltransferase [Massilia oculi]